jgi:copper oxidase (laccase) domain-containing protein
MRLAGVERSRSGIPLVERIDPSARSCLDVDEQGGVQVIAARLPGPFRAVFTTRRGGVSIGKYHSLNLDQRSNDEVALVAENRSRLASALTKLSGAMTVAGAPTYELVSPAQAHGVRVVGAAEYVADHDQRRQAGLGPSPCDGLTLHPLLDRGLAALLLFADCVPVVMVGDVDMAVVHGGWRGILGGIVQQAACVMTGPPALAFIGPSLGPCCFNVGAEVAEAFVARFGSHTVVDGKVDLWAATSTALRELGIRSEQIVNPRLCTACNRDLFYSYRTEGPITGRHGCAAWTVDA